MSVRQSNPTMRADLFEESAGINSTPMTLSGTVRNLGILLLITLAAAAVGWVFPSFPGLIASFVVGLILCLIISFKPTNAPTLSPVYALAEGYFVGAVSAITAVSLKDTTIGSAAIPLALMGTMLTLGGMLFLYVKRIIRVTETMRSVIIGLTAGVMLTYLGCFLLSFIAPNFVGGLATFGNGPIGIGFSVLVIGLAAFNFLLDFDLIERGIQSRAPKYMEWYAAFGTLVTIIWLYLEILNLIRKLSR